MNTRLHPIADIADILGEPKESIRNWTRLPTAHPRHLPSIVVDNRRVVAANDLIDWLLRNDRQRERLLALSLTPAEIATPLGLPRPAGLLAGFDSAK